MSLLSESPESSISAKSGVLDRWVHWVVVINVFLIIGFVTVGKFIRVLYAMALMLHSMLMSLLSKSPKSSIGSESGVLDGWVNWIIVIDVFLIIRFITVGKLIRVFHTMALMLHFMVMFFLSKGPKSGVSSESSVLNGWINWIIVVNVFLIVRFITVGKFVGVLHTVTHNLI